MHIRRFSIRAAAAATLAAVALVLAAPAGPAFGRTTKPAPSPYTITIDSVTPTYATANSTIRVSGTLTNDSGAPASGLSVQTLTTPVIFSNPSQMKDYETSPSFAGNPAGNGHQIPGIVANRATVRWTTTFTSADAGFSQQARFGVYGLEAEALTGSLTPVATDHSYLPYWPGSGSADRLKIAWVWPLIDSPHQGACSRTLTDNSLDQSLSPGGRLGTLLSVGAAHQAGTRLTWAVDPALLSDAKVMTDAYSTGGNATCSGTTEHHPASPAARQWINHLTSDTAAGEMFVTPYADVDVSALTHAGLESDLQAAYSLGQSVAGQIVPRTFGAIGWPADGIADQSVLTDMARAGHITTVLLNEGEMPPTGSAAYAEDAVAATTTGTGGKLNVLLTNNALTSILSASSGSTAASQFAVTQEFFAETAMIASEAPAIARSVVVAPPRYWDPSASVAGQLLTMTGNAPWLQPVSLSQLASASRPSGPSRAQPPDRRVPSDELSGTYIAKVIGVRTSVNLLTSLLASPGGRSVQQLKAAVAATQSSAWRGAGKAGGLRALQGMSQFAEDIPERVKIFKVFKETLAGPSGRLPVSVYNGLDEPIRVRVEVTDSRGLTIGVPSSAVTVAAKQTATMPLSLHSAQMGTTVVRLQLVTQDRSPLPWTTENVSVVSTRYGRAVLVLIVAALGVVVMTSATRWIRRGMVSGGTAGTRGGDR